MRTGDDSHLYKDLGGVKAVLLDGVVQRCLVLDILCVNIRSLTFSIQCLARGDVTLSPV